MKKRLVVLSLLPLILAVNGCNQGSQKQYFKNWNDCDALTALKAYVQDVTNKNSKNYIPVEDRIATFDMDGTFVAELYPTYFEYNMLEYRALEDPNYKDKAPADVVEAAQMIRANVREGTKLPDDFALVHAHAAAKAYSGMTVKEFDEYTKMYGAMSANGFENMTYGDAFYQPMLDVFDYLKDNNFDFYVVSGSDRLLCRALVDSIGIASNKVIGMDVVLKSSDQGDADGVDYTMKPTESILRTDELIIKNLKTNKVKQITQEIGKTPVLSFGNSGGDSAMHNYCLGNQKYKNNTKAFMLIADDDDRDHAKKLNETDEKFKERIDGLYNSWTTAGYQTISMKNDFKTIYKEGVKKVDFHYN
ncbi:MAG: haloacid dehalogenase-like hydrolase [Bacilli bacterium]|nr:haloacid dehalogenase-like hydrolase [Bacilli bacterium]